MTTVEKADSGMLDDIHALLTTCRTHHTGSESRHRHAEDTVLSGGDASGFVLVDHAAIVGFLGTIFSERSIDGRTEPFCNVCRWIVTPDHRSDAARLLEPLYGLRDHTLTYFSPSPAARHLFERLGFQYLDFAARIFSPHPMLFRVKPESEYSVLTDPDAIASLLDDAERKLLEDHRPYACGHVLVRHERDERSCYCIYTTITRNSLRFSHLHHLSDAAVFLDAVDAIGNSLFDAHKTLFLKVDTRLLGGHHATHSIPFTVNPPRMYRSEHLRPDQIDNLYSELVCFSR